MTTKIGCSKSYLVASLADTWSKLGYFIPAGKKTTP